MSTYICEKCGCIDNTACGGNYWSVQLVKYNKDRKPMFKDEYANTHLLCSECTPIVFNDGSLNTDAGQWHNMFPKKHWSEYDTKEELIKECKKNQGDVVNAIEYFKSL